MTELSQSMVKAKNGHFAKALVRQNAQKWAILAVDLKVAKTCLKRVGNGTSLESFHAEKK